LDNLRTFISLYNLLREFTLSSFKTYPPFDPKEYAIAPLLVDPSDEASPRISVTIFNNQIILPPVSVLIFFPQFINNAIISADIHNFNIVFFIYLIINLMN